MAYFARKIDYAASMMGFIAFIEIAKKKGGKPLMFIVYLGGSDGNEMEFRMVRFNDLKSIKEHMPFGDGISSQSWQPTSDWLYEVGVGGGCGIHEEGTWVKIRRPYFRKRKKKKRILKFGLLEHILLSEKNKLEDFDEQLHLLKNYLRFLTPRDENEDIVENSDVYNSSEWIRTQNEIEILESKIELQEARINSLKKELRFKNSIKVA